MEEIGNATEGESESAGEGEDEAGDKSGCSRDDVCSLRRILS
jgi:hypothetical protein